jgi:hypothetical protein
MTNCNPLPPISLLKRIFALRSDGVLIWKRPTSNRVQAGSEAGCISNGYKLVRLSGLLYRVHRIAWALSNGCDPGSKDVDHINQNSLDNRPCNLRLATRSQNNFNSVLRSSSRSGCKGVSWDPSSKSRPWRAYCGQQKLGRFKTRELAQEAYMQHAHTLAGEFFCKG